MAPLLVLVAGPYRSGTDDEPGKLAANVSAMNRAALDVFRAGHIPVTGEAVALPLVELAGSEARGRRGLRRDLPPRRAPAASSDATSCCAWAVRPAAPTRWSPALAAAGKLVVTGRGRTPSGGVMHSGNARVRPVAVEVLSDDWYVLRKATFDFQGRDGNWTRQSREAYDRGNGATILLYEPRAGTVLLTRQFRWPAYANGHPDGMLIETPAGLLDQEEPEAAIRREAEEETGVRVGHVEKLFEVFMSPGSVTERVHFFAAPYERERRDQAAAAWPRKARTSKCSS